MPPFFVNALVCLVQNNSIDNYSRKNVEAMKTGNEKEKVSEQVVPIFIVLQIGALNEDFFNLTVDYNSFNNTLATHNECVPIPSL
jgi:hypothetical protein